MSIEEAIREFTSLSGFYKDSGNIKEAAVNTAWQDLML